MKSKDDVERQFREATRNMQEYRISGILAD